VDESGRVLEAERGDRQKKILSIAWSQPVCIVLGDFDPLSL